MTTIVDGTTGITFPSTISGVSATQQYSGRILQVVNATYNTQISASALDVATGLAGTITPTSSSSKILLLLSQAINMTQSGGANLYSYFTIKRGATQIYSGVSAENQLNSGTQLGYRWNLNWIDSPATTSATTYTVYINVQSGAPQYVNISANPASITLLDIAA